MTHLSPFDGFLGYATLHPLLTLAPLAAAVVAALLATRRRPSPPQLRGGPDRAA